MRSFSLVFETRAEDIEDIMNGAKRTVSDAMANTPYSPLIMRSLRSHLDQKR